MRCVLCNAGVLGHHPDPENTWTMLRKHPRRATAALLGVVVLSAILWLYGPAATERDVQGQPYGGDDANERREDQAGARQQ